jgi:hypothetical protein
MCLLAVLAAILLVVGRCLCFIIYVCGVAPWVSADGVPQPTTIKTENRELQNYRKFPLQLSEVGYRLKWSHNECTVGPLAGLDWSQSECAIGPFADKISAGCDLDRHVTTRSVLSMRLSQFQHCVPPFLQRCTGLVAHLVHYTSN